MIYDISPPISPDLGVFPGDTPVSREVLLSKDDGAPITLSTLRTTVHVGAHVDGANHYGAGAPSVDELPLDRFIGRCQVVTAKVEPGQRVKPSDLARLVIEPRVLIRTGSLPDPNDWNKDFCALTPELVDALASRGVVLIGIDTPSVDTIDSKDLPAHAAFLKNDVSILEGIVLESVPDGVFELVALPLKLQGFDGSPVRAIVRTIEG